VARMVPAVRRPRGWNTSPAIRHPSGVRRWLPRVAVAASLIVALAVGAGAVFTGTSGDRRLADSYRSILAQGHGSFFAAATLHGSTGEVGTVFGYQGQPSWLFATVTLPMEGGGRFDVHLITRD